VRCTESYRYRRVAGGGKRRLIAVVGSAPVALGLGLAEFAGPPDRASDVDGEGRYEQGPDHEGVDPDESVHGLRARARLARDERRLGGGVRLDPPFGTAFAAAIRGPKVLALAMNHSPDDQQQDDGLIGNSGLRSTHS
jgi:hypothetical protein